MVGTHRDLPTGTVTFLFTDIEGSTRLASELDPLVYRELLERHHATLRAAVATHGGVERGTQGDAFLVVFRDAPSAVAAAVDAQRALAAAEWPAGAEIRVRMGIHSGEGIAGGDDYVGIDIDRAARIAAAANGGQVVISEATRVLCERSLPVGVELRDLGRHRLRDLPEPERLWQIVMTGLPDRFPPLRTVGGSQIHLPLRVTSFIGRERDLSELRDILPTVRVLTLLGPGGTGKSSLAVELARLVAEDYQDGAWFVGLESVDDPSLVAATIIGVLGLREVSGRTAEERLIDNLSGRQLLLVIDNFEHLIDAATLIGSIVAAALGVVVVVTSRAPLRIAAEQTYPVQPLSLPSGTTWDLETLEATPSVRLLVDRTRRRVPGFRIDLEDAPAVADICRRLDGLPLGIELAAARIGLIGISGVRDLLADRIDLPGQGIRDAPVRQKTLRDAITWSHDLLDEPERLLFASFAVFAGGCGPGELGAVCGPLSPGVPVTDRISALVDQSLVRVVTASGRARFDMLETIHSFADERFERLAERAEIQRRHALAYLALAEAEEFALIGRGRSAATERLSHDRDNFRAVVRWAIANEEADVGLRITRALGYFWGLRGEIEEARSAVIAALAIPGAEAPTVARMRALEAAGTIDYYSGRMDEAARRYSEELDLARSLGDRIGTGDALFNLLFTRPPSDFETIGPMLDEAEAIYREAGDERRLGRVMWTRGAGLRMAGQEEAAFALWRQAHAISRVHDDVIYEGLAASSLGATALEAGRTDEAAYWYLESLALAREIGDVAGVALSLPIAARATFELIGPTPAATLMGAYEALTRRFGIMPPPGLTVIIREADPMSRIVNALAPDEIQKAMDRGRAMSPDEAADFTLDLVRSFRPPVRPADTTSR